MQEEDKKPKLTELGKIWENDYVCELGILEHINEIKTLFSEWQLRKASDSVDSVWSLKTTRFREHIDKELADLYLILNKYFEKDTRDFIVYDRLKKFQEKNRSKNA